MGYVVNIINWAFYPLFLPFEDVRPDYALLIISALTGVVMLYLYKWTSDQTRLRSVQTKIKAHILEIQLYKTDLGIMLRSLWRVFTKNLTYMRLLLVPALFLIALVVLLVVQCYPRFQYTPVPTQGKVLVKVVLANWSAEAAESASLYASPGVKVDGGPLFIPSMKELDWRVSPSMPGDHELIVKVRDEEVVRSLVAGKGLVGVSPVKGRFSIGSYIENPLETPIAEGSAIESVSVMYPMRQMGLPLLYGMNWIVYFFVVSFIVALAWKLVARVH